MCYLEGIDMKRYIAGLLLISSVGFIETAKEKVDIFDINVTHVTSSAIPKERYTIGYATTNMTVANLKAAIAKKSGIVVDQQLLIFNGNPLLEKNLTLGDYGINKRSGRIFAGTLYCSGPTVMIQLYTLPSSDQSANNIAK